MNPLHGAQKTKIVYIKFIPLSLPAFYLILIKIKAFYNYFHAHFLFNLVLILTCCPPISPLRYQHCSFDFHACVVVLFLSHIFQTTILHHCRLNTSVEYFVLSLFSNVVSHLCHRPLTVTIF
jgi:hypothetical protein